MAKAKQEKPLCVNDLRHAEYYGMQESFDDLYARSRNGEKFTALMDLILKRENILLAYRNIKANHGSGTPGTERYPPRRLSAEYSSLLQEVNMATGQNRSDAKIFQNQTDQRAHWGFHVLGTG